MKRWGFIFFEVIILWWIFILGSGDFGICRAEPLDKEIIKKRKELKDIKKEISITREKQKIVLSKESSVLESLNTLEMEIYKKEKELKRVETQLNQIKDRIHQNRNHIIMLTNAMERTKGDLFLRLQALYKMGRSLPERFIFASQSYLDMLKIDKYLRYIIDFDTRLIETYRYQVSLRENYQEKLTTDQLQCEKKISEVEDKREEIKKIKDEKQRILRDIQSQKVAYKRLIGELEERAKDLQALINKLEKEKAFVSYGKAKPDTLKGKIAPPLHGRLLSLFKEKGQNGVEIKAPFGAEIRAVLPGKVLYSDWFKGFGNIVIIDHGESTFTVYGYCSQLFKKAGEKVSQGEVIALVGDAGSLKGPCLYFEIRHQGKPQDPLHWITNMNRVVSLPEGNEGREK